MKVLKLMVLAFSMAVVEYSSTNTAHFKETTGTWDFYPEKVRDWQHCLTAETRTQSDPPDSVATRQPGDGLVIHVMANSHSSAAGNYYLLL